MHREESLALVAHTLRRSAGEIEAALPDLANAPALSAAERDAVLDLRRQSRNFNRFAEDVLEVGQLETGHFRLNRGRFDLSEFVATLARETDKDRLQLVSESDPVWVEADATRLTQAVGNLLANAAKFTDAGGTVAVAVRHDPAGRAEVEVRDTGIGIDPALVPRLFDVFMQADSGPGRQRGGLGLGLALVRGIVTLHGGGVRAASDGPGTGSAFSFWLPSEAAETAPPPAQAHDAVPPA